MQIPPAPQTSESAYTRDRIIALSDGVFAIAITLLVLEVVPHVATTVAGHQLVQELLAMVPKLVAYFLSFAVIGRFWDYHRNMFRHIYLADSGVTWANLWFLLWVTLIPATAALLGSHWEEPITLTLYAANVLIATAALWGLWRYASSAGYVRGEELHARTGDYIDRYVGMTLLGYALAIPTAFLAPAVSLAVLFLTAILARRFASRILGQASIVERTPATRTSNRDAS
jgi:uncharacterized membrane protein